MRGRHHVIQVQLPNPPDVLKDPGQLSSHPLNLLLGETEARQLRDVQHLFPLDHRGDSRQLPDPEAECG